MKTDSKRSIDLNADLGEGCPWDEALLDRVSSASIACGGHAGSPEIMTKALIMAREKGVIVGAHPGFADRQGFGRREHVVAREQVHNLIIEQVETLASLASGAKAEIRFLKPHGALYNQGHRDLEVAKGIVSAARHLGLPVLGIPGGCVEDLARGEGTDFVAEGFADRRYTADGRLVPRSDPSAILEDPEEIAAQALELVDRGIATLCLHGDNPRSVAIADLVIEALRAADVSVRGFLR